MKKRFQRMLSFCIGFSMGLITVSAETLDDLDTLVGRWIDLRTTIANEQREWDARHEQWKKEIELLTQESQTLDMQLARFENTASGQESERSEMLAREQAMRTELELLDSVIEAAETDLRSWVTRLPESLRQPLDGLFDALPDSPRAAAKLERSKRVQTIVALSTQIENLQHGLHSTREMLEVEAGKRRQVDVLYLGLARAFAVSLNDDWAAVGTPGSDGWRWSADPEYALEVRSAIDVFKRQKAAELIYLPMQAEGGSK